MTYMWNPRALTDVFALPGTVVDDHLRLAGSAQLKILLWYARKGGGDFDPKACSQAIGLSPADCMDALQFWIQTGVITAEEGESPLPAPATEEAPSVSAPATVVMAPAKARPAAVKPSAEEVVARQTQSADFAMLMDTVGARLGRPLSHGDTATLLYLFDTAGLPPEVIVMITVYAVTNGKPHMRYIEKMALDWADREIVTMDAAEAELRRLAERRDATDRIRQTYGLTASATYAQSDMAHTWLYVWKMPMELIDTAVKQCLERCKKFSYSYIHKMLEHWYADGITTVEGLKKAAVPAKGKGSGRPTSFDVEAYDEAALKYTPVYTPNKPH